ncbi:MAG: indolepyruvate oxidoreductase subunit beta [Muribaculaceae bacterium]|nr:indolepyruvate oxidoreductase subunit beta [Muribaculaceae bacterium]MCI6494943.1 indolepyruvate oxidoreductase subunit beta [Bacteroidales bacterium]MDD6702532.1 indolepyruvate oxidoreductase subunit beta [Bacteroidales bacterium]MDD6943925.1 indolepyruvate oxidoreductase subunit beta [Bacteroidales bacterium]MDY2732869.1 indolepyruvate oxidoreductase subunit beta [Muribaculaceae bacterium]
MKSDIVLAGVGGQGILTIATILGGAALADNLFLKQAEVHGMSQRGGDVQSNLRLSSDPIFSDLIPLGGADLIVSLEPMEALRYIQFLSAEGWIVTNSAPFVNIDNYPEMESIQQELAKHPNVVSFDMDELAKEVASARSSNLVLLGAASPFIDMSVDKIEAAVRNLFAPKGEKIVDANIAAFRAGRQRALQIAGR